MAKGKGGPSLLVRNGHFEVEAKMQKTLVWVLQPKDYKGTGKETSTHYFPESTLLAKTTKLKDTIHFPHP